MNLLNKTVLITTVFIDSASIDHVTETPMLELQEILEVDVLLVRHVLQTILTMHVRISLVIMPAHRVINWVPRKTGSLTLVGLLLLHPCDEEKLCDNNTPENAPNR